ncbi:class I SAM-dependent methyltransferase [Marinobacter nauticus]|uniref:class I SAM-dependent methyltransferase n=1 Tax=Marinobacter nauticus TaxID=2743 RepID=UPI00396A3E48|nr:class I SAM-dependent methyltransferase [Marinobacter nauticus]
MSSFSNEKFSPHEIEWTEEKANRLWGYYSSSEAHRSTYFGETVGWHVAKLLRRNGFLKSGVLVDFSCGNGALIEEILKVAPKDLAVYGFDPSSISVDVANSRNAGKSGFKGASQLISYPVPLDSGFASVVVLTEVVEHLDDNSLRNVIGECKRILKPGGRLVITTPNNECLDRAKVLCPECGCTFHRWQHQRSWSPASLKAYLRSEGFLSVGVSEVTWGGDVINIIFKVMRKQSTGIFAVCEKPLE